MFCMLSLKLTPPPYPCQLKQAEGQLPLSLVMSFFTVCGR
jgi:hypothetical protein